MKTFPICLDNELHKQIKIASAINEITTHEWIIQALKQKLENDTMLISKKRKKGVIYGNNKKT
jgi:hypothetical protein